MSPNLGKKVVPVHSTDPDKLEAPMDVDANNDISSVQQHSESKVMQCMNNCEDNDFEMENLSEGQSMHANNSFEVDVTDCGGAPNTGQFEDCPEDVAESSSSFGETDSGTEYNPGVSDGEVESTYVGGGMPGSLNNEYGDVFALRKKKLTDQWRVFIQPLRWHCKWLELQMKELNAQAIKYDNALAKYEQRKQLGLESLHCGGIDSKSASNLAQVKRETVMKRTKRKRKEDMVDLTSYMSHHSLFSFYDKKPQPDSGPVEAYSGNLGLEESLDFGNGSSSLEQLLAKIEMAHLRVCKVKARIEKVIGENPVKFASLNSLSMGLRDPLLGTFCNGTSPPPDGTLRSPMSSLRVASKKVASSSRGDSLVPVMAGPDPKDPTSSPDDVKSPNQKIGARAGKEVEIGNPTISVVANEEPVDADQLRTLSSEKFREQPEMGKAVTTVSGVGSDVPAEGTGPLHLDTSNKRTTSTAKTYVRKRRRQGRLTVRPRKRSQA